MKKRKAEITRRTRETDVHLALDLDGGDIAVNTGIGFLDHMIHTLCYHAGFGLNLSVEGDLDVDDHHSAEDAALVIGSALDQILGDRAGMRRFGCAYAPLDEALARSVVDLAARPWAAVELGLQREMLGGLACENAAHFLISLAMAGRFTLHVDVLKGVNDHHRTEAAFKSLALALRAALSPAERAGPLSTKGILA